MNTINLTMALVLDGTDFLPGRRKFNKNFKISSTRTRLRFLYCIVLNVQDSSGVRFALTEKP